MQLWSVSPGSTDVKTNATVRQKLPFHHQLQKNIYFYSLSIILRLPAAAATTRLKCKLKIQKAWDFSLAQKSVWFNLVNAHPVFLLYIYMCICRLYTHIYSRYTCTVCIVTYIWFYGSKLLSRGYKKKRQSSRLKKIQQQLGTYRQWPSRTVIRHNTDKEDIEGRNTN